ncbi:MAG: biliverdin-producing heme oxygenase [Pseudomonadota bacterium]
MSKAGLLGRLRSATRPLHDDLENRVDIHTRLRSFALYTDHLTRLWRLHTAAEQALSTVDFSHLGFSYPCPYRSSLLEDDLALLGIDRDDLRQQALPEYQRLETVTEGLGCMYVVEGSAKGARTILPAIKDSLDLDANHGASFFYGFGKETGRLWRACAAGIEAIDAQSADGDTVVTAANETFSMFHQGLVADTMAPLGTIKDEPRAKAWRFRQGHTT